MKRHLKKDPNLLDIEFYLPMLEYVKTILKKVSFDRYLFEKELFKAIKTLIKEELRELKIWCYEKFGKKYPNILNRCFNAVAA